MGFFMFLFVVNEPLDKAFRQIPLARCGNEFYKAMYPRIDSDDYSPDYKAYGTFLRQQIDQEKKADVDVENPLDNASESDP